MDKKSRVEHEGEEKWTESVGTCSYWWNGGGGVRAESAAECKGERNILVNACNGVIRQKSPTPYCCQRLRVTHVNCVCPIITPQLAALIDVNYAIKVDKSLAISNAE
ncbi:hypothetical protein Gorai_002975, partial [Gossypium raimondii]|nr:hypothetical protein [Gossypium raimondii]